MSRRLALALGVALAVVASAALGLRLALPGLVRAALEREGSRALGARVEVGAVTLSLLRSRTRLEGVRIASPDSAAPPLEVAAIEVAIDLPALLRRELRVRDLIVEQPLLEIVLGPAGELLLPLPAELFAAGGAALVPLPDWGFAVDHAVLRGARLALPGAAFALPARLRVELSEVEVSDGAFLFAETRGETPRWSIGVFSLAESRLELEREGGERVDVHVRFAGRQVSAEGFPLEVEVREGDARARAEGSLRVAPPEFRGSLSFEGLDVRRLIDRIAPEAAAGLEQGVARGKLALAVAPAKARARGQEAESGEAPAAGATPSPRVSLRAEGEVALDDVAAREVDGVPVSARWRSLRVEIEEVSAADLAALRAPRLPLSLKLARVELRDPVVRATVPERDGPAAPEPAGGPAGDESAPATLRGPDGLEASLAAFELTGGDLALEIPAEDEPRRIALEGAQLGARDLRWPDPWAAEASFRSARATASGGPAAQRFETQVQGLEALARELRGPEWRAGALTLRADETRVRDRRAEPRFDVGVADFEAIARGVRAPALEIEEAVLRSGVVEVSDRLPEPDFETALPEFEAVARGVRYPGFRVGELVVEVPGLGTEALTARGALGADGSALDARASRVAIPPWSPYTIHFSGYRVRQGSLSFQTRVAVEGTRYTAPTHVVLHELDVIRKKGTPTFKERFGVSLDLGLALLRDSDGDIELDLPIEGDAAGEVVKLGPIVSLAFRRALSQSLSAPLRAIGSVVKQKDKVVQFEPEPVPFVRGTAKWAVGAKAAIEKVGGLLAERPRLGVELHGSPHAVDLEALREEGDEADAPARARALVSERLDRLRERLARRPGVSVDRIRLRDPAEAVAEAVPPSIGMRLVALDDEPAPVPPRAEAPAPAAP